MKVISVHQPYAQLIILGLKQYETRNYPIQHRGPLAIHATKSTDFMDLFHTAEFHPWLCSWGFCKPDDLPLGAVLGTVDLLSVHQSDHLTVNEYERAWGDWTPGRFVWKLDLIKRFEEPVYVAGKQGLWEWEPVRVLTGEVAR